MVENPQPYPIMVTSAFFEMFFAVTLALWWLLLLPRMLWRLASNVAAWIRWQRHYYFGTPDPMEQRIKGFLDKKREERLKGIAIPVLYVVVVYQVYAMASAFDYTMKGINGIVPDKVDFATQARVGLNFEGLFISVLCLFSLTFPQTSDKVLRLWMLDAFMMCLYLSIGSHCVISAANNMEYLQAFNQAVAPQLLLSILLGSSFKVGIVNVLNVFIQLISLLGDKLAKTPEWEYGKRSNSVIYCVMLEQSMTQRLIWNAVFVQLVAAIISGLLTSEAKAVVGEREASRSAGTAEGLLNLMCDVVVSLRKDFTLQKGCPRLHALLIRNPNSPTNSQGESFHQYVADDDRVRFQDLVQSASGAGTFHTHLLDSWNRKVAVQVFHTSWLDAENEVNYFLGLQEEKTEDYFPPAPLAAGFLESQPPLLPNVPDGGPEMVDDDAKSESMHSEGRHSIHSAASSGRRRGSRSVASGSEVSAIALWGNTFCSLRTRLELQVVNQSDECRALFGFSSEQNDFLKCVMSPEVPLLLQWLTNLHLKAKRVHKNGKTRKLESHYGLITMKNSQDIAYQVDLSATYKGTISDKDELVITDLELTLKGPEQKLVSVKDIVKGAMGPMDLQRKELKVRAWGKQSPHNSFGEGESTVQTAVTGAVSL